MSYYCDYCKVDSIFKYCTQCLRPLNTEGRDIPITASASPAPKRGSRSHPDFEIKNGILIKYHGHDEQVTIPSGVTEIGDEAFCKLNGIKKVIIPTGVKTIGNSAFAYCSDLEYITIPDGLSDFKPNCFFGCMNLKSITLPDFVKKDIHMLGISPATDIFYTKTVNATPQNPDFEISGHVLIKYKGHDARVNLPDGIQKIATGAFDMCDSVESIVIPEGVTEIEANAFEYCSNLTSVSFPRSVLKIGYPTFINCSAIQSMTIPKRFNLKQMMINPEQTRVTYI